MKISILISTLLLLTSCATSLPPKEQRQLTFTEKTSTAKNEAYANALKYIAQNFNDSSKVIKTQDKDAGFIVLKGNTECNIFRQMGDINSYNLNFTLTLSFVDNKTTFEFQDLYIASSTGEPVSWSYNQLSSPEKLQESVKCLSNLKNGLSR